MNQSDATQKKPFFSVLCEAYLNEDPYFVIAVVLAETAELAVSEMEKQSPHKLFTPPQEQDNFTALIETLTVLEDEPEDRYHAFTPDHNLFKALGRFPTREEAAQYGRDNYHDGIQIAIDGNEAAAARNDLRYILSNSLPDLITDAGGQKKLCHECGRYEVTAFKNKTHQIEHGDTITDVTDLSGWRCGSCDSVKFDAESAQRYSTALASVKSTPDALQST